MNRYDQTAEQWITGDVLPPDPQVMQVDTDRDKWLTLIVVGGMASVLLLAVLGLIFLGDVPATVAISGAVIFFTLVVVLALLSRANVLTHWMTTRSYNIALRYQFQLRLVEMGAYDMLTARTQPALPMHDAPVELPERTSTYVAPFAENSGAAFDDRTADDTLRESLQWVISHLYKLDGTPNSGALHRDGRIKRTALWSKRGGGHEGHRDALVRLQVIKQVPGGYALNLRRYPTTGRLYTYLR